MPRHQVATLRDVPPGTCKRVSAAGRDIVLVNAGGEVFALADRCPHQGGRLSEGSVVGLIESPGPGCYRWSRSGEIIRCPWHGWEFDVRTGQSRCEPRRVQTQTYGVALEPCDPGPVESFPVAVENTAISVDIPAA